jgi:hypothetical protein
MADKNLSWDDVSVGEESVTEEALKKAESMGKTPIGKWLVECIESTPRKIDAEKYTAIAANLKFKIEEVLEINHQKPTAEEAAPFEGRFIYDDVYMERDGEKDGMRNRRLLIASRMGLVKPGEKMTQKTWSKDVIGKKVILTTELNKYKDKDGNDKENVKVGFSGYESIDGHTSASGSAKSDTFEDI